MKLKVEDRIPTNESIIKAMELAWKDHHHARDQTWKTIQMVFFLCAGLLTVDIKYDNVTATVFIGILVLIASTSGILITWHHRKLEKRKFIHIMNCEEKLGLHSDDLLPLHKDQILVATMDKEKIQEPEYDDYLKSLIKDSAVKVPEKFKVIEVINPFKNNTALFILRLHLSIAAFTIVLILLRLKII